MYEKDNLEYKVNDKTYSINIEQAKDVRNLFFTYGIGPEVQWESYLPEWFNMSFEERMKLLDKIILFVLQRENDATNNIQ